MLTGYLVDEMVQQLVRDGLLKPKHRTKAVASLQKCWQDRIALVWDVEDVLGVKQVSRADARKALANIEHDHDASYGVNWDTLSNELANWQVARVRRTIRQGRVYLTV